MRALQWLWLMPAFCFGGAAVSVLVAEACALWSPARLRLQSHRTYDPSTSSWDLVTSPALNAGATSDPTPSPHFERLQQFLDESWMENYRSYRPDRPPIREGLHTWGGFGVIARLLRAEYGEYNGEWVTVLELQTGWPAPCLNATRWEHWRGGYTPRPPRWTSAASTPVWLRPGAPLPMLTVPRVLPYGLRTAGLATNAICYAVCLWMLAIAYQWGRRARRRRTGRCADCGYSLAGLPPSQPCPECGSAGGTPAA